MASQRSPLLPIFLIVLVDVLGFTIVIPLLAYYAEHFGASPLVATTLVSCYAVCSLISTPIIGNLSDRFGRKPLLLISQAGTCAGFLMLAYSSSLWMVFVGRILDGITAGNLSTAQAYISDHTKPENRAKAFGVIGVAFGLGFMVGPAIGAELGKHGLHLPFIAAASLSALSMLATYTLLPTGAPVIEGAQDAAALPGGKRPSAFDIATYTDYFRRPGLGALYAQFFLFTFAFSCFTSGMALFAERRFYAERDMKRVGETCTFTPEMDLDTRTTPRGYVLEDGKPIEHGQWRVVNKQAIELTGPACASLTPTTKVEAHVPWGVREVGLLFTYAGFLGILLQGGLIGRLVKKYGEYRLGVAGFLSLVVGYALLGMTFALPMLLGVAALNSFGNGVLRPVITSRITQAVGRHEQGVALGISGSLSSLAMSMAPPTGGSLLDGNHLLAWALVPATVALIGLVATLVTRPRATPELSSAA
ncbi:MAG: MFS transporter [Deltaproteobacteria bacterium]|nr:MFS transporter [Deltaproteobacteria bacterium]